MRTLVLTLRAHRFETFLVGAFIAAALGGAGFVVARLSLSGIPMACFHGPSSEASCAGLTGQIREYIAFAGDWGYLALGEMVLLPIVSGLFLGIALAGKEIDRGTTVFAWSLTPSRRRWLFARVAPVALLIAVASLVAGLLGDRLEALRDPGVDPALTFEHLGNPGRRRRRRDPRGLRDRARGGRRPGAHPARVAHRVGPVDRLDRRGLRAHRRDAQDRDRARARRRWRPDRRGPLANGRLQGPGADR